MIQPDQKTIARIRKIKCWLLDMDGTVTLGEELLPGADKFFTALAGRDYVFLTNNSSHSAAHYMKRMNGLGIPTRRDQVLTSTDALVLYLQRCRYPDRQITAFPVGTPDFTDEIRDAGIKLADSDQADIDCVLVGFDTTLNYRKLDIACSYIRSGKPYFATNPDKVCPLPAGRVLPDCGAIIAFLETCTGKQPELIAGKPQTTMIDMVKSAKGYNRDEVAVIGDRIYTDLLAARNANVLAISVLTGEATLRDIEASGIKPDAVFESVGSLAAFLQD